MIEEKKERKKREEIERINLGYGPETWVMSNGRIRDESKEDVEYKRIRMSPAKKGHHKMKTFQHMYKDIHRFIVEREWAPIEHGKPIGGVTWIELFILFDISGARSDKR